VFLDLLLRLGAVCEIQEVAVARSRLKKEKPIFIFRMSLVYGE